MEHCQDHFRGATTLFVDQLWRSVRYGRCACDSVAEAHRPMGGELTFSNRERAHASLDRWTPDHVTSLTPRRSQADEGAQEFGQKGPASLLPKVMPSTSRDHPS